MTFWELISAFRKEPGIVQDVFAQSQWAHFAAWYANLDEHIRQQNRDVLDATVPDDLCQLIVSRSRLQFSLSPDGWLRSASQPGPAEGCQPLSALDVFVQFGGICLEDVQEFGSCRVNTPPSR